MTEAAIKLMAARFRALGEVSRLKLIFAVGNGEKNVSQLIAATRLSQANISKHLKILTDIGFLIRRKKGIYVFYSTNRPPILKCIEGLCLTRVCHSGCHICSGGNSIGSCGHKVGCNFVHRFQYVI